LAAVATIPLAAQCIVDNPGGSKLNFNRPADADVPAARFSPLAHVNHALPRWLCFTAGYRARFEGYSAGSFRAGNSDYYLLTRLRPGMVAWQNLNSVRAGVRVTLRKNCMLAGAYNDWWLANAADGFYNASGSIVARDPSGLSGTHIGREYDTQISHRLNRHLELGAGAGYIRSGEFLIRTNHARSYTYPYVMFNYNVF
jgi:hypothetical protein